MATPHLKNHLTRLNHENVGIHHGTCRVEVELQRVSCGVLATICVGKDQLGRQRSDRAAEAIDGKLDLQFAGLKGFRNCKGSYIYYDIYTVYVYIYIYIHVNMCMC